MKKALLVLGGLSLLGYGVYRYFKIQTSILKDFTWKISGFKINKFTLSELAINLSILFTSKADIEAKINKLYLDLYLEGKNVGFINEVKSFIIPAKGSTTIPLNISINPQVVLKNAMDFIFNASKNKDIRFRLKGFANVKSGFISTTIPIDYETSVKEYLSGITIPNK